MDKVQQLYKILELERKARQASEDALKEHINGLQQSFARTVDLATGIHEQQRIENMQLSHKLDECGEAKAEVQQQLDQAHVLLRECWEVLHLCLPVDEADLMSRIGEFIGEPAS